MFLFDFSFNFNRGRKWNEALVKPNLNYNDFFNEDTGQEPGKIIKINDSLQYCILLALILK